MCCVCVYTYLCLCVHAHKCMYICIHVYVHPCGSQRLTLGILLNCFSPYFLKQDHSLDLESIYPCRLIGQKALEFFLFLALQPWEYRLLDFKEDPVDLNAGTCAYMTEQPHNPAKVFSVKERSLHITSILKIHAYMQMRPHAIH